MNQTEHSGSSSPPLILAVDDEARNLQLLGNLLSQEGYRLLFAKSGALALELVKEHQPDLILLDIMMPGMDGFEVCRKLHQDPEFAHLPIIFLTAKAESEDIVEGFDSGGQDYLLKPFRSKELLIRIRTHLKLKRVEEELRRANGELKKINANQTQLFSIIAHDLRHPFAVLKGIASMFEYDPDTFGKEDLREIISELIKDANRVSELLEHLLEWASLQMDRVNFTPLEVKLYDIGENVFRSVELLAKHKHIALHNQFPQGLNVVVDLPMVTAIVRNLVTNSIKFTPRGGKITILAADRPGEVEVCVCDTGVGMTLKQIQKLFNVGEHVATYGTEEEKGSGFGLLLCQQFVERHGGNIRVESTPGAGTVFTFTLSKQIQSAP